MNYKTQRLFKEYEFLSNKANFIYDIICTVNDKLKNNCEWYSKYLLTSIYNLPGYCDDFLYFTIEYGNPCVKYSNRLYDSFEIDSFELDPDLFEFDTKEEIEEYWTKHLIDIATKQKKKKEDEQKRRKLKQNKNKNDKEYKTYLKLKKKFEKVI